MEEDMRNSSKNFNDGCESHLIRLYMAGDITPTDYIYSGGQETGFVVESFNYPRFPCSSTENLNKMTELAEDLCIILNQKSYTMLIAERGFNAEYYQHTMPFQENNNDQTK